MGAEIREMKILAFSDIVISLALAFAFSASPQYLECGTCSYDASFFLLSGATFLTFLIIAYIIRKNMVRLCSHTDIYVNKNRVITVFDNLLSNKHSFLIVTLLIVICWLPILVSLYPGTVINDTWGQFYQYHNFIKDGVLQKGIIDAQHPIFDTMVMGAIIAPLADWTGNWQNAFFIYVLLQTAATAASFAATVRYAYKKLEIGIYAALIILFIYCVFPVFPVSVQTIGKDSLSAWIFVFFSINYLEIVRTDGSALSDHVFLAKMTFWTVLLCLTKKVGFYVALASFFCAVVFLRDKSRIRLLAPTALIIVGVSLLQPVFYSVFGVIPGGKQEMFSIPFQQTARYARDQSDDFTNEEYEIIDKMLNMKTLAERYDPIFADPVKGYKERGTVSDYIEYIKAWISQGIRHPYTYFEALCCMEAGWFSWEEYAPLMDMSWHNQFDRWIMPTWVLNRDGNAALSAALFQKIYHSMYDSGLFRILFSYGFYAALAPAFIIATLFRKHKGRNHFWVAVLPSFFALVLGCWLAPASIHLEGKRYLYPVIYTLPANLSWCFYYLINLCKT